MRRWPVLSLTGVIIVALSGCDETLDSPTHTQRPLVPAFEFLDGAHNTGNSHFYFLPPLVGSPSPTGTFDPTQPPTVTVCRLSGSTCNTIIARFSMTTGIGSEVIRVEVDNQDYVVNWHSDRCTTGPCVLPSGTYRIRVAVVATELGHADVQMVATSQKVKNVDTSKFFPLVAGQTLPIKFRIEQGAVFVVGPSNHLQTIQTPVTTAGSSVQLAIPPDALTQPAGITILVATLPPGTNNRGLADGSAYEFGPIGTVFAFPVTVTIHYDPTRIPSGIAESKLRLFTLVAGHWVFVPGSTVNTATHAVSGVTNHFSIYAALASVQFLPQTGQTITYGPGDDGAIQEGIPFPSPRFTDIGDGTVMDELTGLMWTQDANLAGPGSWDQALQFVSDMNAGLLPNFGHTDWRLPNILELRSLVDHSMVNPPLTAGHPFANVQGGFAHYWSSTTYPHNSGFASTLLVFNGGTSAARKSDGSPFVWPVRTGGTGIVSLPQTGQIIGYGPADDGTLQIGTTWPSPRFNDLGDGTVIDNLTGLMWTEDGNLGGIGSTWDEALQFVADMNAGQRSNFGHTDWRLPNVLELQSLLDFAAAPAGTGLLPDGNPFSSVQAVYWSSTTEPDAGGIGAWEVILGGDGTIGSGVKSASGIGMWPVRSAGP